MSTKEVNRSVGTRYLLIACTGVFLFLMLPRVSGQNYYAYNPLISYDRLTSSETYTIVQDSNHYIWIGSESGIFRYDGYVLTQFINPDSEIDNSVLHLHVDAKNRLWFSTYNGYIGYIQNDSMYNHALGKSIAENIQKRYIDNLYIDSTNRIWTMAGTGNVACVNPDYSIEVNPELTQEEEVRIKYKLIHDNYRYSFIYNQSVLDTNTIPNPLDPSCYTQALFYVIDKHTYYYALRNLVYYIHKGKKCGSWTFEEGSLIGSIYLDRDSTLWINPNCKGIFAFNDHRLGEAPEHILPEYSTSSCYQDHEGNHWITTMEKGIFLLPSLAYHAIPNTGGKKISTFLLRNQSVYLHPYQNDIWCYSFKNRQSRKLILAQQNALIKDMELTPNGDLLFNSVLTNISDTNLRTKASLSSNTFHHQFLGDSAVLFSGYDCLGIYSLPDLQCIKNIPVRLTIKSSYHDELQNIWLATIDGLYSYQNDSLISLRDKHYFFRYRLNHIVPLQKGSPLLLITSKAAGMCIYNSAEDSVYFTFNKVTGLQSNNIRSILVDKDSVIWIGTDNGLNKLILYPDRNTYTIESYDRGNAFPAQEIYKIKRHGNNLFVATDKGLYYFDPEEIRIPSNIPKPFIERIFLNNQMLTKSATRNFSNEKNTIHFHYRSIAFRNHNQLRYRYQLSNYDDQWIQTRERSARYTHLPYGTYTFRVESSFDGIHYSDSVEYTFTIRKGIYDTLWFKLLGISAFLMILYALHLYLVRITRKKDALKFHMYQTERNSLKASINPHFISNSLYSMHDLILHKRMKDADTYLTKLSRLIRLYFENSRRSFVLLANELEALELYVKLEGENHGEDFSYSLHLDQNIQLTTAKIPPTLLQPIVENAFKHGFKRKQGKKHLYIAIYQFKEDQIRISIRDNGVGRQQQAENYPPHKSSTGLSNIQKQLDLLNKMFESDMNLEINDLPEGGISVTLNILCIYD